MLACLAEVAAAVVAFVLVLQITRRQERIAQPAGNRPVWALAKLGPSETCSSLRQQQATLASRGRVGRANTYLQIQPDPIEARTFTATVTADPVFLPVRARHMRAAEELIELNTGQN